VSDDVQDDGTRTVAELMKGERFGFLTTTTSEGKLTSRPMALQEVEFDGDLWFFAERDAPWIAHLTASPQVNVGVGTGVSWVSLTGHARVVDDPTKKRELWNQGAEAWLPQGPDDPSVVLVKVDADSAEYWDAPGGRLATLFSFVKARMTGERIDAGENEKVDL
jgi:general stress protein 26